MKSFYINILVTDSEHCRDQKSKWAVGLFSTETFHSDLSTARVSGGGESELDCWLGYSYWSPESVSRRPSYEGHLESKERFAIKKYLLIIGKKKNMQVLSYTFTYFST